MTKRIFRSIFTVALAVFFASLIVIMGMLYNYFSDAQKIQLAAQTSLAAQGVENSGMDYFEELELKNFRITWIAPDGTVKYDTDVRASQMENHMEREEIKEAMEKGVGESIRYSTTLTEKCLYSAKRLSDGSVIRLSGSHYTLFNLILNMAQPILIVILIAIILSLALAFRLSKKIVEPLNNMDLDNPETEKEYEELSPLLERIGSQQHELKMQSAKLQQKKDEFEAATNNMSEGLVLLNDKGKILSINQFASNLLGISNYCIGKDILLFNNSYELQELLRKALQGEHTEAAMPLFGNDYQINASPVVSNGKVSGVALLIFDITEKEKSEQMRREFTANVSHELKTPLHTILGCAELMSNGVVKAEDIPEFSQKIYTETKRMITLVEDIIRLSHLDEGATTDMKREQVDLYELAQYSVRSLESEAQTAGVALELTGERAELMGIPQLLSGIIFNLCDNAIKYNNRGGRVAVSVANNADSIILSVKDDGIGIPDEQQERIFERFYRVDKSHSKEVGGTGLGLSIVKHAAILHNAQIELNSILGKGTAVTVKFPKTK